MIWLGPDQLDQLGVSRGILVRNRDAWTWRETGRRGRNGKPIRECQLESMGRNWIERWLAAQPSLPVTGNPSQDERSLTTELDISPNEGENLDTEPGQKAGAEDRLTEALLRYDLNVREAFLAEATRLASIIERFERITPKQTRNAGGKLTVVREVTRLCDETACTDAAVLAIEPSRSKPRSFSTMQRWASTFRTDGLATFLRKPPEPTGKPDKRKAEISAEALAWINANIRKHASPKKLYQKLAKIAAQNGWTIPSAGWIWRRYDELPAICKTIWFAYLRNTQSMSVPPAVAGGAFNNTKEKPDHVKQNDSTNRAAAGPARPASTKLRLVS